MNEFDAEVRGFFFGEGCADIFLNGARKDPTPRMRIGLGARDLPILEAIRERYGGSIHHRAVNNSYCWQLVGKTGVLPFLSILEAGAMPSAKRAELVLVREACKCVPIRGKHRTCEQTARLHQLKAALQSQKRS